MKNNNKENSKENNKKIAVKFIIAGIAAFNTGCFAYICVLIIELINILSYALHVASLEKGSL